MRVKWLVLLVKIAENTSTHIVRSIRLTKAILVPHVEHWRMIERLPQHIDKIVGENLLSLGKVREAGNQPNCSFHNHGLVIGLSFASDLGRDNVFESLQI